MSIIIILLIVLLVIIFNDVDYKWKQKRGDQHDSIGNRNYQPRHLDGDDQARS